MRIRIRFVRKGHIFRNQAVADLNLSTGSLSSCWTVPGLESVPLCRSPSSLSAELGTDTRPALGGQGKKTWLKDKNRPARRYRARDTHHRSGPRKSTIRRWGSRIANHIHCTAGGRSHPRFRSHSTDSHYRSSECHTGRSHGPRRPHILRCFRTDPIGNHHRTFGSRNSHMHLDRRAHIPG